MNLRDGYRTQLLLSGDYDLPPRPNSIEPQIDWARLDRDVAAKMADQQPPPMLSVIVTGVVDVPQ